MERDLMKRDYQKRNTKRDLRKETNANRSKKRDLWKKAYERKLMKRDLRKETSENL